CRRRHWRICEPVHGKGITPPMRLEEFDFVLPDELVALRPVRPRPSSRLLVASGETLVDSTVARLGEWLRPGDLLVLNDTRVIPARLTGIRTRPTTSGSGRARIEVTLASGDGGAEWEALARPARRRAQGETLVFPGGRPADVHAGGDCCLGRLRVDPAGQSF